MSQPTYITLLDAADVKVRFNDNEVLTSASLTIRDGDHLGMVGRNGCGKSTFLKILAEIAQPDAGDITRRSGLVTGYLPQDLDVPADSTVLDTIREGAARAMKLLAEYDRLRRIPTGSPNWNRRLQRPARGTSTRGSRLR